MTKRITLTDAGVIRHASMTATGRFVAIRGHDRVSVVDALGTGPEQSLPFRGSDLAFVGGLLWTLESDALRCLAPGDLQVVASATIDADIIVAGHGRAAATAALLGPGGWSVATLRGSQVDFEDAGVEDDHVLAVHGPRLLCTGAGRLRLVELGRGDLWQVPVPGEVVAGAILFEGRAVVAHVRRDPGDEYLVLRSSGERVHSLRAPTGGGSAATAFAPARGLAVLAAESTLYRLDLRYGRVLDSVPTPLDTVDLSLDDDGRFMVLAGPGDSHGGLPHVLHVVLDDLFRPTPSRSAEAADATPPPPAIEDAGEHVHHEGPSNGAPSRPNGHARIPVADLTPEVEAPAVDAADGEPAVAPAPEPIELPDVMPLSLGQPPPRREPRRSSPDAFFRPRQHLDALLDLVAARAALAIADAWNSGRLSGPGEDARPFEREVNALLGAGGGFAPDRLEAAAKHLAELTAQTGARAKTTMAGGMRLPFIELTREFKLTVVAAQILLAAMAPALRGEIARLYSVLSNDPNRPLCDRHLVELIVGGDSSDMRDDIARELAPDSALVRYGLVRVGAAPDATLFAPITVDDVLLERMRGHRAGGLDDVATRRTATAELEELAVPRKLLRDLVLALAEPATPENPLRLVLRGRRGSGRHTVVAALAARVGRDIAVIDCSRLPRAAKAYAVAVRTELFRSLIRGVIPVLSGLELIDVVDTEARDAVRQVLRAHPGPLVVRTSPEAMLPMDAGFLNIVLPGLAEGERVEVWRSAIQRHQLIAADLDGLAARYRIGPGIIHRVVESVARRPSSRGQDAGALLDQAARQHVAARLDHVATHVTRVASWDQVALPDEMMDSLREFIGRARHRRTVYERWGYDSRMTTSRGLTALFYGPPGTGKSMVAGVIASELGLELYRVDLARVVSKWVGETEKNLAEVFDAAEDGQVLILFDEADSLFAKRTDVRTSNDRYANLEVNYLLQRIDTFEGIAILTSNLEGSIDQAFKRRLSLRMYFPFPDEEMRARLWAAHLTPQTPTAGQFDFVDLARRFPLSGGYIRNCSLRAAFLAAQENKPMTQDHLLRAIQLEYRELGKLSTTGRME